jgi:hypothetical protein
MSLQAILGYYGKLGDAATACPANSYCEAGTEQPVACPVGTVSRPMASTLTDCVSAPGYYGAPGQPGKLCPAGSYCPATAPQPMVLA